MSQQEKVQGKSGERLALPSSSALGRLSLHGISNDTKASPLGALQSASRQHEAKPRSELVLAPQAPKSGDRGGSRADVILSYDNEVISHKGNVIELDNGQRWQISDPELLKKALAMNRVMIVNDRDDQPDSWTLYALDEQDTTAIPAEPISSERPDMTDGRRKVLESLRRKKEEGAR
jgi:hypothetical protein